MDLMVEVVARSRKLPRILMLADELATSVETLIARRKHERPAALTQEGQPVPTPNGDRALAAVLADYREARERLQAAAAKERARVDARRRGQTRITKRGPS